MERQVHEKIKAFILKHHLISRGDELVLGVSGGADSMMLLYYFFTHKEEYGITLKVAHIHHGIRKAASLDAQLVESVCKEYHIPFFRHDCDIKKLAKERKISEEEAGREERYNFFISLLNTNGKIVTAHNMNDQAETMLMRFVRGTDIKGLAGILPKRDRIIRPLLCLSRDEIEAYCKEQAISYRDDETNFKPIYTRNKVRLECIPYIKEHLNPAIVTVLGKHSNLYREEDEFLVAHTKELFNQSATQDETSILLDEKMMRSFHVYMQKRVILMAIESLINRKNITSKHVESCLELLSLQTGKEVHLPYGLIARRDYKGIRLMKASQEATYCTQLQEGMQFIKEAKLEVEIRRIDKERISQNNENIYTKYIDYGKIKNELQIRTRRASDFISLPGGSKKLKKLFTDDKISRAKRDTLPLIVDGNEVVWIIGNRLNSNYYITDDTEEALEIKIRTLRE